MEDIIVQADLPNLFLIPETPELVAMNDSLSNINRREFWIKEKLIDRLKNHFDFIIMDEVQYIKQRTTENVSSYLRLN